MEGRLQEFSTAQRQTVREIADPTPEQLVHRQTAPDRQHLLHLWRSETLTKGPAFGIHALLPALDIQMPPV